MLQCGIIRVDRRQQFVEPGGAGPGRRGSVIDALLFAKAVQEPRFSEEPEVPGDAGLALAQHPADFPYGELTVPQKRYKPQPGGLG